MNDNVFVLILWLNEICTLGIMLRRCDESHRRKGFGLQYKMIITSKVKMDNEKVAHTLLRAPTQLMSPT